MKMKFYKFLVIWLLMINVAYAQPVIQKIEPLRSFPNARIVISGSGFSSTSSQLQVWFDQVKGKIIASTEFAIEVEVPAEARLSNITVMNLATRLSATSKAKFMPVFSGEGFVAAKLATPLSLSNASPVFDIISSDIDGDNKPDLIGSSNATTSTSMVLHMNQSTVGNINFVPSTIASLTLNAPTGHLAVGDLNLDGKPDVVASRSGTTSNTVFVLLNKSTLGNPDFAAPLILTLDISQGVREVGISDINGDGKPEIVVANSITNNIYIFKNESAGGVLTINTTPVKIPVTGATETWALELQDMDGDGKTDIVASTNQSKPDLYVLKNVSTPSSISFSNITKIPLPGGYNDIATADFNRDGKLDLISTSLFTSQAMVLLNKSSNAAFLFDAPITLATDAQPFGIDVSDLNGDNFPDFVIPSRGTSTLNVFLHNGNPTTVGFNKVTVTTGKTNWFVRAGDLDGDAKPDIAFTSFTGTAGPYSVDILRNQNCHKPEILNTPPVVICPAQNIRLKTIPIPGVTFDWSNGFSSIKNNAEPFVDITAAASYTVTAKGENGACSVTSAPLLVQSGAGALPADPAINTNAPLCAGNTLNISTPTITGATYSWTGPNGFTSNTASISIPNATVANAGIYSLTIKVGDCSSNTVTKRVDVVSFGNFSISSSSANNTMCQGQSITLSVNTEAGYNYQWMKDGTNISGQTSATLAVTQEGSYKVKVSNTALGCSIETAAVAIVAYAAPVANFTIDPATTGCVGTLITFTNNSIPDSRVPAGSIVFEWDFGDNTSSTISDPTHTYTTAQTFNPKLTISYADISSCVGTLTKSINISAGTIPTITATKSELCGNGSETSTLAVTETTFTSFLWSTGADIASINVTAPETYSVETVDANGCEGFAEIIITEKTTDCSPASTDFPYVFTPNGDLQNDFWIIPDAENKQECTMNIFDGRGRRVLQKKGFPIAGWDGRSDEGKDVPDGTYYYVFSCPDVTPTTGSVLIVR
jgi:gliding motility-associated-like protein